MDSHLQSDVIERLERDTALAEKGRELVLAAILPEVEECLGGKTPTLRAPAITTPTSSPTAQELSLWADTVERLMAATKKSDAD